MATLPVPARDKAEIFLSVSLIPAAISTDCEPAWGLWVLYETP